jgi:hypothetical protein
MSLFNRWHYFRRIFRAYFGAGNSQLSFWHDQPSVNENFTVDELGEYYMPFLEKADYAGTFDNKGIPMLDYHGKIGRQYNPIAIAQWGLGITTNFVAPKARSDRASFYWRAIGFVNIWSKMQAEYWCGTITLIGSTALHCVPHGIPHWRRDRVFRC